MSNQNFLSAFKESPNYQSSYTSISTAAMKAICYSKIWMDSIAFAAGDQYNCRILIIKFSKEDPSQYTAFVNTIFAAHKLKIVIDGLVIT